MFPLIMGIVQAGLGLLQSVGGSISQQRQQAKQLRTQAAFLRNKQKYDQAQARVDADNIGRNRSRLTEAFRETQGANRVKLGAGNVDMASGSALDVSLGNINRYAQDVADNSYSRAVRLWEASENDRNLQWQIDAANAQSSYLKKSAKEMEGTLLDLALPGISRLIDPGKYPMAAFLLPVSADMDLLYHKGISRTDK